MVANPVTACTGRIASVVRPIACLGALAVVLGGCGRTTPAFPVDLPLSLRPAGAPAAPFPSLDLSLALADLGPRPRPTVRPAAKHASLAAYLVTIAEFGPANHPEAFPAEGDVLAYLVNAHVAWTLALTGEPTLAGTSPAELRAVPFTVGGSRSTLAALADEVLARAPAEPRFVLFLNPGFGNGPALPPWPLDGASLAWQLAAHAGQCGADPAFWHLDEPARVLELSAFVAFMPGLPRSAPERALRLLDLVPPPPETRRRILATCGHSMLRCRHVVADLAPSRW